MDYKTYRTEKSISSHDMISVLRGTYPKYGKPSHSMVENPDKYGVCLLPEAENLLTGKYGKPSQEATEVRRKPNRAKPCRYVVYLSESDSERVKQLMRLSGYTTAQDLLETLLISWVTEGEGILNGEVSDYVF